MPSDACAKLWLDSLEKINLSSRRRKYMDNESREKLRPVLYLAAGAYLVYLAFKMYGGLGQMAGTEHTVSMIAMVVFGVFGAATFIFGLLVAKKVFLDQKPGAFGETPEETEESEQEEEK